MSIYTKSTNKDGLLLRLLISLSFSQQPFLEGKRWRCEKYLLERNQLYVKAYQM